MLGGEPLGGLGPPAPANLVGLVAIDDPFDVHEQPADEGGAAGGGSPPTGAPTDFPLFIVGTGV